jgi:hypothetical protein
MLVDTCPYVPPTLVVVGFVLVVGIALAGIDSTNPCERAVSADIICAWSQLPRAAKSAGD